MMVKSKLKLFQRFLQGKQADLTGIIRGLSLLQHPFLHQRKKSMADNPAARITSRRTVHAKVFQMPAVDTGFFFQLACCRIIYRFIFLAESAR
ncbi:hypothetical protein D3C72_2082130 [compost metagenome]